MATKRRLTKKEREAEKVDKLLAQSGVIFPPVVVSVKYSNEHEGSSDSHMHGDEVVTATVHEGVMRRYCVAEKMREMADFIAHTHGNPIDSAEIVVLLRRKQATKIQTSSMYGRRRGQ
jgi:hypothetical protein